MRLNFSNAQPEQIEEGIRRLGLLLQTKVAEQKQITPAPELVPA
jgi:hypothetical protein